jgi:hypothetical protein
VTQQINTVYGVPIPGEAKWVKEHLKSAAVAAGFGPPTARPVRPKRTQSFDDEADDSMLDGAAPTPASDSAYGGDGGGGAAGGAAAAMAAGDGTKKSKLVAATPSGAGAAAFTAPVLNHPLPGEQGPAVLIKLYDGTAVPKLNEIIEVLGIYEADPNAGVASDADFSDNRFGWEEEIRSHHPPASVIPRLHGLAVRQLSHNNPLVPAPTPTAVAEQVRAAAPALKQQLREWLAAATGATPLVAEYVILHLLSKVSKRLDGNSMVLGKLTLNVFGFSPATSASMKALTGVLEALLTKIHVLPMSLGVLNTATLLPEKDVDSNRLLSGRLQLAEGTELVLNETSMREGSLTEKGIKNLQALAGVCREQAVEYVIPFAQIPPFPVDVPTLVMSEGKSCLPCDVNVPFKLAAGAVARPQLPIDAGLLARLRAYVTVCRALTVAMDPAVADAIQTDFVAMRQANPQGVTGETLHSLLVMANLNSASKGETTLTTASWREVCRHEAERATLMPAPPPLQQPAAGGGAAAKPTAVAPTPTVAQVARGRPTLGGGGGMEAA